MAPPFECIGNLASEILCSTGCAVFLLLCTCKLPNFLLYYHYYGFVGS